MSEFRKRVLEPLLVPIAAFVFLGGIAWGLSRIFLATTTDAAAGLALMAALAVLTGAGVIAAKGFHAPQRTATIVSYIAIVAGGSVFAATAGIRPIHPHLPEPSFTITAANAVSFNVPQITLEPKAEQVVRFTNQDPAASHNWGVLRTREFIVDPANVVVDPGTPFGAGVSRDYLLTEERAREGSYFYFCFVHPNMRGTLTIGAGGEAPPPPRPTTTRPPGPASSAITLIAKDFAFNLTEIRLTARRPVRITLDNRDPSAPHNVSIYRDAEFTEHIFHGEETVTGPDRFTYSFTAPPAGSYFFKCDFHPAMTGAAIFV
ncbi:MAG: cupredoxin domain-containing protein [Actinomycetota bacterium]